MTHRRDKGTDVGESTLALMGLEARDLVISGFLQLLLLWMLYCSCIILCLCCKINKLIKSFSFVLFNVYFYSLSTATVTMSIPILIT